METSSFIQNVSVFTSDSSITICILIPCQVVKYWFKSFKKFLRRFPMFALICAWFVVLPLLVLYAHVQTSKAQALSRLLRQLFLQNNNF